MQDQQRKLLLERRCAWCAEPATVDVLLRGGQCGHCGRTSPSADPEKLKEVLGTVRTHWKKQRAWAYGGLAIATLVTGWLPLVSSFVMVAVLIYLRVTLLRRPLAWFGTARRFTSGFLLRLWLTAVGVGSFVLAELCTFIPVAGAPIKVAVGLASVALFTEFSILYLTSRLKREASNDTSLQWHEWILPASVVVLIAGIGAASTAAVIGIASLLS